MLSKILFISIFMQLNLYAMTDEEAHIKNIETLNDLNKTIDINKQISKTCLEINSYIPRKKIDHDIIMAKYPWCDDYLIFDAMNGLGNPNALTKKEHIKKLGLSKKDNLIDLVKKNQFQKAFNYYQLFYDELDIYGTLNSDGDSVITLLIKNCSNDLARELLDKITGSEQAYYIMDIMNKRYDLDDGRLKSINIKLTKDEMDKRKKRCELDGGEEEEEVFGGFKNSVLFQKDNIFMEKKYKNGNLYDYGIKECNPSYFYKMGVDLFGRSRENEDFSQMISLEYVERILPEGYPAALIKHWDKLTENDKEEIIKRGKEGKIKLLDFEDNFIFEGFDQKIKNELYPSLKIEIEQQLLGNDYNRNNILRTIEYHSEVLLDSSNGKNLLELAKNIDSDLFKRLNNRLQMGVLQEVSDTEDTRYLESFIKYGSFDHASSKRNLEWHITKNRSKEQSEKMIEMLNENRIDDYEDPSISVLKSLIKKSIKVSDESLKENALAVCSLLESYNSVLNCDLFVKKILNKRKEEKVDDYYVNLLTNLIDKASQADQDTLAMLLTNYLGQLNPELASEMFKRMNLNSSILKGTELKKLAQNVMKKINQGDLDCSFNRTILNEFIEKHVVYQSNTSTVNKCYTGKINRNRSKFIGVDKENIPLFVEGGLEEVTKREIEEIADKGKKIKKLSENGQYVDAFKEGILLTREVMNSEVIKALREKQFIRSLISEKDFKSCVSVCAVDKIYQLGQTLYTRGDEVIGKNKSIFYRLLENYSPSGKFIVLYDSFLELILGLNEIKGLDDECRTKCIIGTTEYTADQYLALKKRIQALDRILNSEELDKDILSAMDDLKMLDSKEPLEPEVKDFLTKQKKKLESIAEQFVAMMKKNVRNIGAVSADVNSTVIIIEETLGLREQLVKEISWEINHTKETVISIEKDIKQRKESEKERNGGGGVGNPETGGKTHDPGKEAREERKAREKEREDRDRERENRERERENRESDRQKEEDRRRDRELENWRNGLSGG